MPCPRPGSVVEHDVRCGFGSKALCRIGNVVKSLASLKCLMDGKCGWWILFKVVRTVFAGPLMQCSLSRCEGEDVPAAEK